MRVFVLIDDDGELTFKYKMTLRERVKSWFRKPADLSKARAKLESTIKDLIEDERKQWPKKP